MKRWNVGAGVGTSLPAVKSIGATWIYVGLASFHTYIVPDAVRPFDQDVPTSGLASVAVPWGFPSETDNVQSPVEPLRSLLNSKWVPSGDQPIMMFRLGCATTSVSRLPSIAITNTSRSLLVSVT